MFVITADTRGTSQRIMLRSPRRSKDI